MAEKSKGFAGNPVPEVVLLCPACGSLEDSSLLEPLFSEGNFSSVIHIVMVRSRKLHIAPQQKQNHLPCYRRKSISKGTH